MKCQFYNFIFDITDTKLCKPKQIERKKPKPICTIQLDRKAIIEAIRLPQIFNTSAFF